MGFLNDLGKALASSAQSFATGGVSSLVDAGLDALSQFMTNSANADLVKSQNEANKELAQYQYELDMAAWREQSDYNSPKKTMERLVAAGINPRAYQQLGQFANAAAAPTYKAPSIQRAEYKSPLSAFNNVATEALANALSIESTEADVELKEANAKLAEAKANEANANAELLGEKWYTEKLHSLMLDEERQIKLSRVGVKYIDGRLVIPTNLHGIDLKLSQANLNKIYSEAYHAYEKGLTESLSREKIQAEVKYVTAQQLYTELLKSVVEDDKKAGFAGNKGKALAALSQQTIGALTDIITQAISTFFSPKYVK